MPLPMVVVPRRFVCFAPESGHSRSIPVDVCFVPFSELMQHSKNGRQYSVVTSLDRFGQGADARPRTIDRIAPKRLSRPLSACADAVRDPPPWEVDRWESTYR